MGAIPSRIIFFDGFCNLCNGIVQFIIRRDPSKKFRFSPLQSERGLQLIKQSGLQERQSEFIVFVREGEILIKSSAVLLILNDLGGVWKLFYAFLIIPKFIRDFFYDVISKRRYKLFGQRDKCMIPSPGIRERFLE